MAFLKAIPYKELYLSAGNMRKSKPCKEKDKQLEASIGSVGLIQNLVVGGKTKKGYPVEAGGRRYRKYGDLIKKKHQLNGEVMADKDLIQCLVLEKGETPLEYSLAENATNADAHPVDTYDAYSALVANSKYTVPDLARKFGRTQKDVRKILKLGQVASPIREACRQGDIDLDTLMAFTVADTEEKQLEIYDSLKDGIINAWRVREMATGESVSSNDKLVKFVGVSAYKKAGGAVAEDLFKEVTYIQDCDLLNELVTQKAEREIEKLEKSYSWAEFDPEYYSWNSDFVEVETELKDYPKSKADKINKTEERIEALESIPYDEITEDQEKELQDLENELEELYEEQNTYLVPKPEYKDIVGCVISIDSKGKTVHHKGLAKLADFRALKQKKSVEGGEEVTAQAEKPDYSNVLQEDIKAERRAIAKAALVKNPKLAQDMMRFSQAVYVLGEPGAGFLHDLVLRDSFVDTTQETVKGGKADNELEDFKNSLDLSWVDEDQVEAFKKFRKLTEPAKLKIAAFCSAFCLMGYWGCEEQEIAEVIFAETDTNPADYYRPTKDNFFKRINLKKIDEIGVSMIGEGWQENFTKPTKATLAEALSRVFVEGEELSDKSSKEQLLNWLPDIF
jgi:ParB family chromosome partitioning protein